MLIALAAVATLTVTGAIPIQGLIGALTGPTIWLLIGSCAIAAGLSASGLRERTAVYVIGGSRSVRGLAHRTTLALLLTTFAVPSTSGRAAPTIPVFRTLGRSLPVRRLHVALSLLFPTVIVLSAFASLLGAGAHLVTANLVTATTGVKISFVGWLALGAPVAIATSHLATEVILVAFLSKQDRRYPIGAVAAAARTQHFAAHGSRLTTRERRAVATLAVVATLWLTEPLHALSPALVAIAGGTVMMLPRSVSLHRSGHWPPCPGDCCCSWRPPSRFATPSSDRVPPTGLRPPRSRSCPAPVPWSRSSWW